MIAVTHKGRKELLQADILVVSSGNTYAFIQGCDVPTGWRRIPLSFAKTLCTKSSAQWVIPHNSSEGHAALDKLIKAWIDTINRNIGSVEKEKTVNFYGEDNKRFTTLIDVDNNRKRKARWL